MSDQQTRTERDALGEIELNADAPRGIYTQRVLSNFPQKNIQNVPLNFLRMYIRAKRAYAKLNQHHGKLTDKISSSIQSACSQLLGLDDDSLRTYFPISQIQSGGGTCTNMNINEIIAHFATEQLASKSDKVRSHDHVNASQSSNDTFPGVARITAITSLSPLLDSLLKVQKEFARLSATYSDIEKVGRTHLQDAVVIKLGDEF
jgi:aspartate ammonia-lyase